MFVAVSIFTQIVILNMLIALMGDTFDRVIENKLLAKLKLKVKVVNDFIFLLQDSGERFIFLATPKIKDGEQSTTWEGKITEIRRAVMGNFATQKEVLSKKMT